MRFAVIDTETTGLDAAVDRVVSLAVVPVSDWTVRLDLAREVLVNPGVPIPPETTALHGISDEDVAGAEDLPTVLVSLRALLDDQVIVGHNLDFDLGFLAQAGIRAARTLDTLAISRLLWRSRGVSHSLDAVASRVGVRPNGRHTALGDAITTAEVLIACQPLLADRGLDSPEAIGQAYREQRSRRARVRRSIRRRSTRRRLTARTRPPRRATARTRR